MRQGRDRKIERERGEITMKNSEIMFLANGDRQVDRRMYTRFINSVLFFCR